METFQILWRIIGKSFEYQFWQLSTKWKSEGSQMIMTGHLIPQSICAMTTGSVHKGTCVLHFIYPATDSKFLNLQTQFFLASLEMNFLGKRQNHGEFWNTHVAFSKSFCHYSHLFLVYILKHTRDITVNIWTESEAIETSWSWSSIQNAFIRLE